MSSESVSLATAEALIHSSPTRAPPQVGGAISCETPRRDDADSPKETAQLHRELQAQRQLFRFETKNLKVWQVTPARDKSSAPCVLNDFFDPRANGLNFLRLVLAASVIYWHSYAVLGLDFGSSVWRQPVSSAGVDGFFAISGFLILRSWDRWPHAADFIRARVLRIFPGFYALLLVTVLVFAPVGVLLSDGRPLSLLADRESYSYLWKNIGLWIFEPGVAGTPADVPYSGSWNASLWTLAWEFACYVGVLAAGLIGLLRIRTVVAAGFVVALALSVTVSIAGTSSHNLEAAARLSLMFSAGMVLYAFRDMIPVSKLLIAGASLAFIVSLALPNYRILAALPYAYLLIIAGGALRHNKFRFTTDVSYGVYIYGFPVQQLIYLAGIDTRNIPLFATIALGCTLPLAWASWTFIERPALHLKRRSRQRSEGQT